MGDGEGKGEGVKERVRAGRVIRSNSGRCGQTTTAQGNGGKASRGGGRAGRGVASLPHYRIGHQ